MEANELKAGVDLGRVRASIGPVLSAHQLTLVDLEWVAGASGWTLRITIERTGTTDATLAECAEVSRDVSQVLDVEDFIEPRYNLEVSSPGLERALKSRADFERFAGRLAKVKLQKPAPDGQRVLRGTIEAAPADAISITVDGKRVVVPYADVSAANLVFELLPQPKKGKGSKGRTRKERSDKTAGD